MGDAVDPHSKTLSPSDAEAANRPEGPPIGEDNLSLLACFSCKKRKVKCNRVVPVCSLCSKIGASCEYPTHAEKPGPKAGTPQRNKRRRIGNGSPTFAQPENSSHAASEANYENGYVYDLMGGSRAVPYGNNQAASHAPRPPQRRHSLPDVTDAAAEQGADRSNSHPGAPTFSQLMYPSHEQQTRTQSPFTPEPETRPRQAGRISVETVCEGLKISVDAYHFL